MRTSPAVFAAAIAVFLTACGGPGAPAPDMEVVEARQTLMGELQILMLPINQAATGAPFDQRDARIRAEAASAMLTVFPFLFPEGTDVAATAGMEVESRTKAELWNDPEALHAMSERAAQIAFELAGTADEDAFREQAAALAAACDTCHAAYQDGYEPSPY